jgi:hypothetical protein
MSIVNSEGGRISHLLEKTKLCVIQENLAKARAYIGRDSCVGCKTDIRTNTNVTSESAYLLSHLGCYNYVKPPVGPESVRIARVIEETLSKETDPTNSKTRFADYAPAAVNAPCPFIDPALNPYLQKPIPFCPLPNTPLNPAFPV